MVNMLIPDQVVKLWPVIKHAFFSTAPAGEYDDVELLRVLLSGKAQCWVIYRREGDVRIFEGLVITTIIVDAVSSKRDLLVYFLYGKGISDESWREGVEALKKWAEKEDCRNVVAFTDNEKLVEKVKSLGGKAKWLVYL